MSTTYVPNAANNPASFTLPSDLDDADAESVNSPFRGLADKLQHVHDIEAALKAVVNTFVHGQIIDEVDAAIPLIKTTKTAADHPGNPSNKWKRMVEFPIPGSTRTAALYMGASAAVGVFAIIVNARWGLTDQKWIQQDTGESSFAMIITDSVALCSQVPGAADWATWPNSSGHIAGSHGAFGDFVSAANGFITPGSTGSYAYAPVKIRQPIAVPLSGGTTNFNGGNGEKLTPGMDFNHFPLRIPENSGGCDVEIMFKQATSAPSTFHVAHYTADWTTPGALVETYDATDVTPAASGYNKMTLTLSGLISGAEYRVVWQPGNTSDTVVAIRATSLFDYGPVNTL